MSDARTALEAALAARPGDVAIHSAYADFLAEAGDPRGDYIRLQLALEDRNQPADRLRAMEQEAFAIRREHEREWLGPLAPFVFPDGGPSVGAMIGEPVAVTWKRGWVHTAGIDRLPPELAVALASCASTRLLKSLEVWRTVRGGLAELKSAPWIGRLRHLTIGEECGTGVIATHHGLASLIRSTPRLTRLALVGSFPSLLPRLFHRVRHLRTLQVATPSRVPLGLLSYNPHLSKLRSLHLDTAVRVDDPMFPLGRINEPDELRMFFDSPNFPGLRYLTLRLRGFGDAGVDELIASGLIRRLRGLDLCRCEITDDGAAALAACPDVRALEYLHLDNNYLSPVGVEALARVGVTVSGRQWFADTDPGGEYLA